MFNYVTEIADLFLARCSGITILSPLDYTIIAEWEKQEIPLAIVLDTMNKGFEKVNAAEVKVESIGHFQEAVKKNFREWLRKHEAAN